MATPGKDVFRRNGFELAWASAFAKIDNDEFFGFTGVDYEEKLERAFARGMDKGGPPRGITRGQYTGSDGASLKMYKASALAFIEKLAAKAEDKQSYGSVSFFFSLQYVENDVSITEELYDCYLTGAKRSAAPGADALVDELPFMVTYVKLKTPTSPNGLVLFDNRRGRY